MCGVALVFARAKRCSQSKQNTLREGPMPQLGLH
jgi:hypothetical protein